MLEGGMKIVVWTLLECVLMVFLKLMVVFL